MSYGHLFLAFHHIRSRNINAERMQSAFRVTRSHISEPYNKLFCRQRATYKVPIPRSSVQHLRPNNFITLLLLQEYLIIYLIYAGNLKYNYAFKNTSISKQNYFFARLYASQTQQQRESILASKKWP